MICPKCQTVILLENTKFCSECGTKLEALPPTPDLVKVFSGVTSIKLDVGNHFNIMPASTNETKITIKAPEELKKKLKINVADGVLSVHDPSSDTGRGGIFLNGIRVDGGSISIGGNLGGGSITVGGNSISIKGRNITLDDEAKVVITITTPIGVDVSIDSNSDITGDIGNLDSKISLDTSGRANFLIGKIKDFEADVSGSLAADIATFNGGKCNVDIAGSCALAIRSGTIEKLIVDVSGSTLLDVEAETEKAVIDVSGSIRGRLRANIVHKDISGHDSLTIIR